MVSVASLLNPLPTDLGTIRRFASPCSDRYASAGYYTPPPESPLPLSNKKPKMVKDAAIFAKGKVKGEVRYPSFQDIDDDSLREMKKFHIFPLGKIEEFPRHIPYNSDKKRFLEKTGRESFEGLFVIRLTQVAHNIITPSTVFQYTFKPPGEASHYTVMWDYNIGIVRITPFFKCCKYSKVR